MRQYELQLEIGGCVKFEYAHHDSEALEETANQLAKRMNQL
jgi:hypothetical protein